MITWVPYYSECDQDYVDVDEVTDEDNGLVDDMCEYVDCESGEVMEWWMDDWYYWGHDFYDNAYFDSYGNLMYCYYGYLYEYTTYWFYLTEIYAAYY